jgi:hypothetical protein
LKRGTYTSRIDTTHCRWDGDIMSHIVMGYVNVLQVLLLILRGDVFKRQGYVVQTAVIPAITGSIHWEWLKIIMYSMSVSERERSQW